MKPSVTEAVDMVRIYFAERLHTVDREQRRAKAVCHKLRRLSRPEILTVIRDAGLDEPEAVPRDAVEALVCLRVGMLRRRGIATANE